MEVDMPTPQHKSSFAVLLDFAEGGSLYDRIKDGPMSEDELRSHARDILEGLRHIHDAGFMHLDIKPANIFLGESGGPTMIGDFGRMLAYKEYQPHGTAEGDSTYLAPEFYTDQVPPVHGPDVFSLGVTLLECATDLEIPRSGASDEGYQLLRSDRCPEQFLQSLSPELQIMLRKMLRKNPDERPTAEQLLDEPFFASLPPVSQRKRKVRSTSSPGTPFMLTSAPCIIASSAPTHHYMASNRMSLQYGLLRGSFATSSIEDPSVCRRIDFATDPDC
jgi:serine/threonine protein kinase